MATKKVQFTVHVGGEDQQVNADIEDTNNDGTISDDEVRAQAEARLREVIGRNAERPPGRVEVVSFRIDQNNDKIFNEPVKRFTSSPLAFDINSITKPATASMETNGLATPAAGLSSIAYDSDGQAGQSGKEALTFSRNLFSLYNVDFDDWAKKRGSVTIPAGLQAIIQSGNRKVNFGSDNPGGTPAPVSSVLNTAREELAAHPDGKSASATDPVNQSILNAASHDISQIEAKLRKLNQMLEDLIFMLINGMIDIVEALPMIQNVQAQIGSMRAAVATVRVTDQMSTQLKTLDENTTKVADAMGTGAPSGSQSATIERGRAATTAANSNMQALNRLLETITGTVIELNQHADKASQWRERLLNR